MALDDLPNRYLLAYPKSLSEARRRPAPDRPAVAEAGRFEVQRGELLRASLPLFQVFVARGETQEARHVRRRVGREEHATVSRPQERELTGAVAGDVTALMPPARGRTSPSVTSCSTAVAGSVSGPFRRKSQKVALLSSPGVGARGLRALPTLTISASVGYM